MFIYLLSMYFYINFKKDLSYPDSFYLSFLVEITLIIFFIFFILSFYIRLVMN